MAPCKQLLLLSLPWADYLFPSIKIGALAAHVRREGHAVQALHSHLGIAADFGLEEYARVVRERTGEELSAALLFPECAQRILQSRFQDPDKGARLLRHFGRAMRKAYRSIAWRDCSIAGFTVDLEQLFASLLFAKWIKRDFPQVRVLFGGQAASRRLGASILQCFPQVDWCISGEGERPLAELLRNAERRTSGFERSVPGLIFRTNDGIAANPERQLPDLNDLPDPDYDHYFDTLQRHSKLKQQEIEGDLLIEGGRGCTHRCAFCSSRYHMHGYRLRPPQQVAEQMRRLSERHRTNRFLFTDLRTHPHNDRRLFDRIARQRRDYRIFYDIRAENDKPLLRAMRFAGVTNVQIGIEALATSLLRKMNKGTRFIQNLQAMKYCAEMGVVHTSNLILGFPTESQRDIDTSVSNIDFALAYQPPSIVGCFHLLEDSQALVDPRRFRIQEITSERAIIRLLPPKLRPLLVTFRKDFRSTCKNSYRRLLQRYRRWKELYRQSQSHETFLLTCYDVGAFLRIMDRRSEAVSHTLEEPARELYLFCDSIKSFEEIRKRFPKVPEKELRKVLRQLFKLKVMYTEDDDWLSLAIHASPENRRHMPFL